MFQSESFIPLPFFIATILLIACFKGVRVLPPAVGSCLSDFAIPITVIVMILVQLIPGTKVVTLAFPHEFIPNMTFYERGWVVDIISNNSTSSIFIAIIPALLGTTSIFMTQIITTTLVTRKEFHLVVSKDTISILAKFLSYVSRFEYFRKVPGTTLTSL